MKQQFYKSILSAMLLFLVLVFLPAYASAEDGSLSTETVVQDYSDDQTAYGRRVAELNRQLQAAAQGGDSSAPGNRKRGEKAQGLYAVLCRTEEQVKLSFDKWNPAYVIAGPRNCYTLYFQSEAEAAAACEELSKTEGIRYAEPDAEVNACEEETAFHSWGAERMKYGAYADYVSDWGGGDVTVAVIDSGVSTHPFLEGRIVPGGYDYVDGDNDPSNDLSGHGTKVAGVVADCTNGAPVRIYPIRVLDENGKGSANNLKNAICEAIDAGARVINLSLTSNHPSQAMDDAVMDAVTAGVTVVGAAGNQSEDTANHSPARLHVSGVIIVGSADANGNRSSFSNYGESVDVYTYGRGIECCSAEGGFATASGTSIAAPHITALSALVMLVHPELSPESIEQRIVLSAPEMEINIPNLMEIIPSKIGFHFNILPLAMNEEVILSDQAWPKTALETITYISSDESVLQVENGRLIPISPGTAEVTASCTGFEDRSFTVSVKESAGENLTLPGQLSSLGDEAFSGVSGFSRVTIPDGTQQIGNHVFESCGDLEFISIPGSVETIGQNDFSNAILLCPEGSAAEDFAVENNREYILIE